LAEREAAKAEKDSVENKVIDLTVDSDSETDVIIVDQKPEVAGPSKVVVTQPKGMVSQDRAISVSQPKVNKDSHTSGAGSQCTESANGQPKASPEWSCPTCTLLNEPMSLQCDACLTERPLDPRVGWTCMSCGETGIPHDFWSCLVCGTVKATS